METIIYYLSNYSYFQIGRQKYTYYGIVRLLLITFIFIYLIYKRI